LIRIRTTNYQTQDGKNIIILQPMSNLDFAAAWQFRMKLQQCVSKVHHYVVVNLSEVDFIDSSGLRSLMVAMRYVDHFNGKFRICNINPRVKVALEVTKMNEMLEIFATEEEALEEFCYQLAS